jgi:putative flavoprotein involved in K+ transport
VRSVSSSGGGFRVETSRGAWHAENVVVATGHCDVPHVPALSEELPRGIVQRTAASYRRPSDLPEGPVLVVGASASGAQIAEEVHRSGRPVTLSVGRHARLPRRYRGRDIMWWLDALGVLDEPLKAADAAAWRTKPSSQLVGRTGPRFDLGALADEGVRLVGRALHAGGGKVHFAPDLARTAAVADDKLARLLERVDEFVALWGIGGLVDRPDRPARLALPPGHRAVDLVDERFGTVIWATGYRRAYPWLRIPALDRDGEIRHRGGVADVPGLYVLGLPFLRRRASNFIDGVGKDAEELASHIHRRGRASARSAA